MNANGHILKRIARPQRGFTLIELLVVVAILGIMVAIILPSVNKAREIFKQKATLAEISSLSTACDLYAQDFEGAPPPSAALGDLSDYVPDQSGKNLLPLFLTGPADAGEDGYITDNIAEEDGYDDWGYRTIPRQPPYGPYNGVEQYVVESGGNRWVFRDSFEHDILYFSTTGGLDEYDADHNETEVPYLDQLNERKPDFVILSPGKDGAFDSDPFDPDSEDGDDIGNW